MSNPPLWRWPDLCEALGLDARPGPEVSGISIDTRSLRPGELFVALTGERDGHDFLDTAQSAGAAGALVRRQTRHDLPLLPVDDTLEGLWALGRAARARMGGRVVAITGSAGKTTAREWLETILRHQSPTHASTGSFNNHIGVPLSLARMPGESRFGVFEIGTNHPGEIAPLSTLAAPDVSMLLNVLPAHIGNFADLDALRQEKLSIEAGLGERGTLIVPDDLDLSGSLTRNVLTFGMNREAHVAGEAIYARGGADVTVTIGARRFSFRLNLPGEHRVLTALAVFGALFVLDADLEAACDTFATLSLPKGRGNTTKIGDVTVIDDSYNSNPVSMRYAIEDLAAEAGTRVAILGEMLELGEASARHHAALEALCGDLDGVITVGAGFNQWGERLGDRHWLHVDDVSEIDIERLAARLGGGASVLVKGGNKIFWVNQFVDSLIGALTRSR